MTGETKKLFDAVNAVFAERLQELEAVRESSGNSEHSFYCGCEAGVKGIRDKVLLALMGN